MRSMVALAPKAEDIGLDVFATGEHHNPPFVPSSHHSARLPRRRTEKLIPSAATTLITANDWAESPRTSRCCSISPTARSTSCSAGANTAPVYPWFGRKIRDGIGLAIENRLLYRL
jgi:hypothetical protein